MKKKLLCSMLGVGILLSVGLGFYIKNEEKSRRELNIQSSVVKNKEDEQQIKDEILRKEEKIQEKEIVNEAKKELEELKKKRLIKNKKLELQKEKKREKLKKEKKKQDENREKKQDLLGMFDEEKMMKEEGKTVVKPNYTTENTESNHHVEVQTNGKLRVSEGKSKTVKKEKDKEKEKGKEHKLTMEDLVMTDEEEAAYWGYTLEEWNHLPDEEKFGTIEDSKANTEFGGPSIGFEFD